MAGLEAAYVEVAGALAVLSERLRRVASGEEQGMTNGTAYEIARELDNQRFALEALASAEKWEAGK